MKLMNKSNLKRREAVGVKGVGKSSLIFRAGTSRFGYTNARERGRDYQPEGYGNLEAASPETLLTMENIENEVEALRYEREAIDDKIRERKSRLRDIALALPQPDISGLRQTKGGRGVMALQISWMSQMNDNGETYEPCDACKKKGTEKKPLLLISTTGRSNYDRNLIFVHQDCLKRRLRKIDEEINEERRKEDGANLAQMDDANSEP